MSDITEQKQTLRNEARRALSRMDVMGENPDDAAQLFFDTVDVSPDNVVASYWAKGREFDASSILQGLMDQNVPCALPRVVADTRVLDFALWRDGDALVTGAYDIKEPAAAAESVVPDIVIVPMLAFDRRGYRLGQGGGYYDTTLATLRREKEILCIGVAYAQQACLFNLPVEDHDQPLDIIITPAGIHDFRK